MAFMARDVRQQAERQAWKLAMADHLVQLGIYRPYARRLAEQAADKLVIRNLDEGGELMEEFPDDFFAGYMRDLLEEDFSS